MTIQRSCLSRGNRCPNFYVKFDIINLEAVLKHVTKGSIIALITIGSKYVNILIGPSQAFMDLAQISLRMRRHRIMGIGNQYKLSTNPLICSILIKKDFSF